MRGFTFVEVMIATVVMILLVSGLYVLLESSARTYASTSVSSDMDGRARDVLDRLAREMGDSAVSTFAPQNPTLAPAFTFRRNTGFAGGAIVYGPQITFAYAYDTGETDNGIDDNRDQRVDEGILTRTENGQTVVVCRDVREGGFTVTRTGSAVDVVLTLERRDERNRPVVRTYRTTVTLRN